VARNRPGDPSVARDAHLCNTAGATERIAAADGTAGLESRPLTQNCQPDVFSLVRRPVGCSAGGRLSFRSPMIYSVCSSE
jgi:hypothetical protein